MSDGPCNGENAFKMNGKNVSSRVRTGEDRSLTRRRSQNLRRVAVALRGGAKAGANGFGTEITRKNQSEYNEPAGAT